MRQNALNRAALLTFSSAAVLLSAADTASARGGARGASFGGSAAVVSRAFGRSTSGMIDTVANGQGTVTQTIGGTYASRIVTTTDSFANGKTYTRTATIT